jgi:DNA-binding IclR family transcriptional regulator
VRWKRGSRLLFASVGLGTTFPLLNSTTGRLFLAFMPPEATKSVLEAEIAQAEAAGRKRPAAGLDKLVATIRRDGYAEAESHLAPGIWAATAPVFDSQGQLVAGLTIIGLEADPETERRRSIDLLRAVTAEASQRLGAPT